MNSYNSKRIEHSIKFIHLKILFNIMKASKLYFDSIELIQKKKKRIQSINNSGK